ncbi:hypothetical protein [Oscillibacter sp.]|uniref:hypothetical protein n=1 Tax=Oscillibacter sp. TaxID=1945593 RepID=UPI00339914C2
MKPFKVGHSYACQYCGEESCWGCEIARKELDPEYTEDHENEYVEDVENGNKYR